MKKIAVVIYKGDDWNKKIPLENSIPTRESFEDLYERGRKRGVEFHRASLGWFDMSKFHFKKTWTFRDGKWIKVKKPIKPDLIFDKVIGKYDYSLLDLKLEIQQRITIFNDPLFKTLLNSKLNQYLIFGEFMPRSFVIKSKADLLKNIGKIRSQKAVAKPFFGSGGFGIIITERTRLKNSKLAYPFLLQEFVKSEKGIPGFSKEREVADLRIVFMNHKPIYALSRIARKGSLFTNFHQGATPILVPLKFIPQSVRRITEKVVRKLSIFPHAHYSIDFIFDNFGKPKLIEINTTPGFDLLQIVGTEAIKEKNFNEFMEVFN
ncbi:MAG: ATP-grasp domain-containing protein [Candidatus Moranbacteria bacterium]|nr:ATP-grasp domain-containing protein [Candidatus Moranbacteria bacterium]